ncbi:tetraacyldisaccharide 4'-kinase [Psychrobacter jeotgali]|uniref:tetraacyldisaccharide 4'-kinase n=1 Tax=Psychrobacter jeotgali TaxID=179010 RepID=UPI001917DB48|nr:tetraacyldisaccharide 4'-kinase [Psychrobacter jeotgali]
MSLETTITDAWQRKAPWLWLLLPVSGLYGLVTLLRRQAYKLGLFSSYEAPIPVMVIGNITVGGSGKTPLIISLVDHLQQHGVKVGVISRGYGGDSSQMPALVTIDSLPSVVGDEPCLIVSMTQVPMAVCPNRQQAIELLIEAHPDLQLIIADDGLQHYALERDIEWIVVDAARGFGNKQLLPTGFLREPLSRLKNSTVIYHQKPNDSQVNDEASSKLSALTMQLQPDSLQPLLSANIDDSQNSSISETTVPATNSINNKVHAVSGIGYPQRFFNTLEALGFEVIGHAYPDHHDFGIDELLQYKDYPIIVTSKDAVKIRTLLTQDESKVAYSAEETDLVTQLWVLPVTAVLSDACYQTLEQQLTAVGIVLTENNK